jgi:type IV pilus assembly protein PilE
MEVAMKKRSSSAGFSLIEVLLVLAIIGIISGIAIPSYLGQRRRARVIGDAKTNAQVMAMQLETRRADNGIYGPAGVYTWNTATPTNALLPAFTPKGQSKMDYSLTIDATGLVYVITVTDPSLGGANALITDQNGNITYQLH